jgi:protein-S-isoprenylcysteine O-methyltransferase Ste14
MNAGAARWLDHLERIAIVALYGFLVLRVLRGLGEGRPPANLLLLASEGLVLVFILIRRPATIISRRPFDWLLAFGATTLPMMVRIGGASPLPPAVGAVVLVMGTVVQLHAKLCLARSFGCVPAHRGLVARGPYKLVRHPMYTGYLLGHAGFLLLNPTGWNLGVYTLANALQVPRLLAEERLLSEHEDYRRYQATVRYRLIPGVF